ncbi:MAG: 50S ribosomal protein L13 [Bdellovibrionales bacterium]|jgi:large subunit ribosomal protein L13|nr:50S ribosomal protein L13 [Bdellovibrionales bacterium]
MKTWNAKTGEVDRNWWVIDATDATLGRLATQVAGLLKGKHKPQFTPHVDTGDFVVVLNTDKIKMSGNKMDAKKYFTRSRYFGSIREKTAKQWMEKDSTHIVREAVKGMLPKNKLSSRVILKLKMYKSGEHPHSAQKPTAFSLIK